MMTRLFTILYFQVALGVRSGDATFILPNGGTVQSLQPDTSNYFYKDLAVLLNAWGMVIE